MNYIQSLFVRNDQNLLEDTFGWVAPHYHLMSWALSCLTIKKQLGEVKLCCNHKAKEILIDVLGLPYDEVSEQLEGWQLPHPKLWALSKIYTYSIQKEPFLHIDGDVYLFDKLPNRVLQADVAAQNIEEFTDYYYSFMTPINRTFTYQPECLASDFRKMENLHALNAGILGGCNIDFFQRYTKEAFKYVEANLKCLEKIDADRFNVFFEQHLCYKMAEEANINVEYLLPQSYHDNSYLGLDRFHDIQSQEATYFHLLGNYKADEFTCQQMAKTLHALYPEYYYKIISLFPNLKYEYQDVHTDEDCVAIFLQGEYKNLMGNSLHKCFEWKPQGLAQHQSYDYERFVLKVQDFLDKQKYHSHSYLNGRDSVSHNWYYQIFKVNTKICVSPVIDIISSKYDWGKIYRSNKTSGIAYYNRAECNMLDSGDYYSILVSELSTEGFSLYDIDEFEKTILENLNSPKTVTELIEELVQYVEEDVRTQYMGQFKALVYECLKRLVLMKAVMPFN